MSVGVCSLVTLRYVSGLRCLRTAVSQRPLHTCSAALGIAKLPAGSHTIPDSRAQVETSTVEWHYVERLFPQKSIPKPTVSPGEVTPSGWVAPSAKPGDHPYFIRRSQSHMLPVYLHNVPHMSKYRTFVHHVEGDIFALLEELQEYLKDRKHTRILNMRAHEPHQKIEIKGQYVAEVREFLLKKGF
ncbi:39S ribosomal protein L49, mitochondrial-like [Portunus trituberculatus]|uniref:39S ribosomal protein L49, mitochondrial-like n=1 Tax=Portunus trituberculatus TaxID=210409 RepID=UPI001E1D02F2|nr:39S ribosomal protein L49, mitochondrial-like [Portunus trituberculatus]